MITDMSIITATIDWLQFTTDKEIWPAGMDESATEVERGLFGYNLTKTYRDGRIVLRSADRPDMRTHIILNGATIQRLIDAYGYAPEQIINDLAQKISMTRIDVCVDIMRGCLDFQHIERDILLGRIKTRAGSAYRYRTLTDKGDTVYIGAPSSAKRLRIYDKAAEQKVHDLAWTRIELQVRKPEAQIAVCNMAEAPEPQRVITAMIRGFADFPDNEEWRRVISEAPVTLSRPPRNISKTWQWLVECAAPALAKYQVANMHENAIQEFMKAYKNAFQAEMGKMSD